MEPVDAKNVGKRVQKTKAEQIVLKCLTWNIENLKRNHFNLKTLTDRLQPDLMFFSEPNVFSHDLPQLMRLLSPTYAFSLNADDKYDDELPLIKNNMYGGTMIVWRKEYDAHITIHPVTTSSFLPIIFSPPGAPVSIHIALYLPTSGKENEFVEQICLLRLEVEELCDKYPNCLIFMRGDGNQ